MKRRCWVSITRRACSASGPPTAPACARSSTASGRPAGTALYDAIDVALPLFESRQHPRAALLLVSDGADTASDMTPTTLKQKLVRSDVFLYAIGIDSLDARNSTRINPFTLNELTSQGGGYTEIIGSAAELGPATERIAEELNQSIHDWLHADDARATGSTTRSRAGQSKSATPVRVTAGRGQIVR